MCVSHDHAYAIRQLLESGADGNVPPSTHGKTALQMAARYKNLKIFGRLLEAGVNVY